MIGQSKVAFKPNHILGIGNPLLDIQAQVDQDFLDRFGIHMNNAILAEAKHLPIYNELKSDKNVKYAAGGSTLNSIRVCQWALKKISPNCTGYIGCIGSDDNGKTLKEYSEKDGVSTYFQIDQNAPTGVCGVGILNKERTLVTNLAAANNFKVSHLENENNKKAYKTASIVYISGFFLTVSLETVIKVAKNCTENQKIFAINISANFIPEFYADNLNKALYYSDYVFMNEIEAKAYAKHIIKNDKLNITEISKNIAKLPKSDPKRPRTVVITRSENSTIINKGEDVLINICVDPLDQNKIIDLNGAGDAFVGGFLAKLAIGGDIIDCVKTGHKTARYIIQQSGVTIKGEFEKI